MSRVSIGRRLDRLFEHYRPGESLEGRVARLNDSDRARYETFRRNNARALANASDDPAEAFEAWLSGRVMLDELPPHIAAVLVPETVAALTAMAKGDYVEAWRRMAHPDRG